MAHSLTRLALRSAPLALALSLAACGGSDSSTSSTGSASSSSSASCSGYVDVISSTVRSNSNADAQCSVQIANADSYLAAAKAACAKGDTATATTYYTQYQKTADYAVSVVKTLCPGSGSSSSQSPTLPVTTYNLFVCRSGSNTVTNGLCTTSSSTPTSTCSGTWYNAGGSYTTQAACAADAASRYGLQ
jgi:hypothetical protein